MHHPLVKVHSVGFLAIAALLASATVASAQSPQYKIQPDGVVLKLKRLNVTTFRYAPFAQAELRRDRDGNAVWYFKADTGAEYTAPAPDQPPAPETFTAEQLAAAITRAQARGFIPAAAKVEYERGAPRFQVRFERNTLDLRWHAQVAMSAQEYEIVNRTLSQQGYQPLFAVPYTAADRSTRFLAAWRK